MASDSRSALRIAIKTALDAAAGVTALVPTSRIVTSPESDITLPYIEIGASNGVPFDAKTELEGLRGFIDVHVYGQTVSGSSGVEVIQSAICDALDKSALSVTGQDLVNFHMSNAETFRDADQETWHGVQQFNFITAEA